MQVSLTDEGAYYHKQTDTKAEGRGESKLFRVGLYTFTDLSLFLVN